MINENILKLVMYICINTIQILLDLLIFNLFSLLYFAFKHENIRCLMQMMNRFQTGIITLV